MKYMTDVTGQAIKDYYEQRPPAKLWIYNKYGPREEMPVEIYFRDETLMPELELRALHCCKGNILDIGAGAGSHALLLQQQGHKVTGLDVSPLSVQVMQARGLVKAVCADIFCYRQEKFDTLLMLMNGIGLTGSLERLRLFLQHAKGLIDVEGQILLDSSDVAYLYRNKPLPTGKYYGEIAYQYSYKSNKTDWFSWLYVDKDTLEKVAGDEGWQCSILHEDSHDQYLARLTLLHA